MKTESSTRDTEAAPSPGQASPPKRCQRAQRRRARAVPCLPPARLPDWRKGRRDCRRPALSSPLSPVNVQRRAGQAHSGPRSASVERAASQWRGGQDSPTAWEAVPPGALRRPLSPQPVPTWPGGERERGRCRGCAGQATTQR